MIEGFNITVKNKLIKEKRYINVYHHSTRSVHLISYNNSISLPLGTAAENDYLYISAVRSHGNLWEACLINVPSWIDFEFSSEGKAAIAHGKEDNRTILEVPPGPPTWQLNITRPAGLLSIDSLTASHEENVTISDHG